jgi:hypothetical protein
MDGDSDIVVGNSWSDCAAVFVNNGSGGFDYLGSYGTTKGPAGLATGDLDGDNDLDLVVACMESNAVSVLFNEMIPGSVNAEAIIQPATLYSAAAHGVDPLVGQIYLGNFPAGIPVGDIDPGSVGINDWLQPDEVRVEEHHPDFLGHVLCLSFDLREFIDYYGLTWGRCAEHFLVKANLLDGRSLSASGDFTLIGHTRGDCDGSGGINVSDIVCVVEYVFSGGDQPQPWQVADADCGGSINVADVVVLIDYVFADRPALCSE